MHECPNIRAYYENQGKRVSFKDGSFRVAQDGWKDLSRGIAQCFEDVIVNLFCIYCNTIRLKLC